MRGLVREVPRLLLMAIGLLFLASLVMPLLDRVTGAETDPEQRLAARIEDLLPRVRDYDHIALPTTAPPAGAMVQASRYRDGGREDLRFMYRGFTVFACAREAGAPRDVCRPPRSQVLATHREGAWTTYLYGSGWQGSAPPQPFVHFRDAELTLEPEWLRPYARTEWMAAVGHPQS